ncbi:hypothetical protein D3C78_933590 [compost metagenome]
MAPCGMKYTMPAASSSAATAPKALRDTLGLPAVMPPPLLPARALMGSFKCTRWASKPFCSLRGSLSRIGAASSRRLRQMLDASARMKTLSGNAA